MKLHVEWTSEIPIMDASRQDLIYESVIAKDGTARRKYHLAMACVKAGDPKRGRQVLEAALRMDPRLPEAHEARRVFGNGTK